MVADGLKKAGAAARADKNDAEALDVLAAAVIESGQPQAALPILSMAEKANPKEAETWYERARAYLALRRLARAHHAIDRYESAKPGQAKASLVRGSILSMEGDDKAAKAAFEEAARRDPNAKAKALYGQAALANLTGDIAGKNAATKALLAQFPSSPQGEMVRRATPAATAPPTGKPWWVAASAGFGNNSNVIGLGTNMPLPSDISSKSSSFYLLGVDAGYRWAVNAGDTLTLGYQGDGTFFTRLNRFNGNSHAAYMHYDHVFDADTGGGVRLTGGTGFVGGDRFFDYETVRANVVHRWAPGQVTELVGTGIFADYRFPVFLPQQNRDGNAYGLALVHYMRLNDKGALLRASVFGARNDTRGSDYQSQSKGLMVGVSSPLAFGVNGAAAYTLLHEGYDNKTSFTAFTRARTDNVGRLEGELRRPMGDMANGVTWDIYIHGAYIRDNSNIAFFKFRQTQVSAGVTVRF